MLKTKGIQKSEILYIGDTLIDYYAAKDAGIQFYGLSDRTVPKAEFIKAGAETISAIEELEEILH
jgi:phosphoglycolate phosphatase-like HAD superfamily hydrolase